MVATVCAPDAFHDGSDGITLAVLTSILNFANGSMEDWGNFGIDYFAYHDYGEYCSIPSGIVGSTAYAIPNKICGKPVTTIESNCFTGMNTENTVAKIPDTVTTIESNAFDSTISTIIWLSEKNNLNITTDAFNAGTEIVCLENSALYNKLNTSSYDVQLKTVKKTANRPNGDYLAVLAGDDIIYGNVSGWENIEEYNYSGANGNRTTIYDLAFANNNIVKKIDVSGWNNLTTIGNGTFMNCTNLETVNLPKTVTTIGSKSFLNCKNLTKVVLSDKITSIGDYAFDGMAGTVYYPSNIKSVIKNYKGTFSNFVEKAELSSIAVTIAPTKTSYIEEQNFDKTGMKVTATYNNGTSKEVTNYTITDGTNLAVGKTNVAISYTEDGITKTTTQNITVAAKELSSIAVTTAPTKTSYKAGEKFDKTGMEITATYSDGSSKKITEYKYTPETELKTTDKEITISYTENKVTKTATQKITVTAGTQNTDKEEPKQDATTNDKELPKTGVIRIGIPVIIISLIAAIISYKKYKMF